MDDEVAFQRLFERIDDLQAQIKKICDAQAELQSKFDSHLLVAKELNQYKNEQRQLFIIEEKIKTDAKNSKWKRAVGTITLVITTISLFTVYMNNR